MKIIRLAICFLMAAVSALMSIANLLILTDADRLASDPREEWQLIVFTGVFILIFVIASYLFVVQLRRLINEQKINREDK
jgi:heme/copper-type cytochrome/quinol oxidase subunit 4